jgi:SAM-dependent methyltransferase
MIDRKKHWQKVYESKTEDQMSWFQPRPEMSLRLIRETGVSPGARIIDIGGGASRLIDCLLDAGYCRLGVLDITDGGLAISRNRLGPRAAEVEWIVSDVERYKPENSWDVWHDRAVFHFLVGEPLRAKYKRALEQALSPKGHVVLATFGSRGPERCSGLPVRRYSAEALSAELGSSFALRESLIEYHRTPSGTVQEFLYSRFQRRG